MSQGQPPSQTEQENQRVIELETELAHQSATIDELNEALVKQWDEIDLLKKKLQRLTDRLEQLEDEASSPHENTPPPHY